MSLSRIIKNVKADKIITPRLDQWLMQEGDIVLQGAVKKRMVEVMSTKPRFRPGSFSASARGNCERQQVFNFLGVPGRARADSVLQNLFNDGTWRHLRWQAMLLQAGILRAVEVGMTNPALRLKGSMDGVGEDSLGDFGWELKGIRTLLRVKNGPSPQHLLQIHSYMFLSGLDRFSLIYEDKANQEWREFIIVRDPAIIKEVTTEIDTLNRSVEKKRLPPVLGGCANGRGPIFNSCPFRETCRETNYSKAARAGAKAVGAIQDQAVQSPVSIGTKRVAKRNRRDDSSATRKARRPSK